jgi:uncharacterized repeat protein (TIGR01451 family)
MSRRTLSLFVLAVVVSTLAMSTSAFAGANAGVGKVAVHVIPHASRTCAKNFPSITACEQIITSEDTMDVDAFPVFFDLVEYQGFDYGMTFPGPYSCAFTSCSDLAIGTITWPGDGISHAWYVCQPSGIALPGWGWIYGTGQVEIVAHPTAGGPIVGDCDTQLDELVGNFYAGIGGEAGEDPCVAPDPVCVVTPTTLDFGTVVVGEWADLTFTIENTGGGTLTGSVSEACEEYDITDGAGAYSLGGGQSKTITVRFQPTGAGTQLCTIDTDTACDDVSCTGVGDPAPDCEVLPATIDFGIVTLGEFVDTTITIQNVGGGTLTGGVSEACAYYEIQSGAGAYSLTAGQTHEVVLRYAPTDAGTHNCNIQTGAACDNVPVTGVGDPLPACDVSQTTLDFGTVTVGEADTLSFTITNTGGGTLSGSVSETCDHYTIVAGGGAYSLTAGQFVDVDVEFAPGVAGTHPCTIETGTDCANVSCTGVGELAPACDVSQTTLDFGTVTVGEADTLSFTITNTGGGTLSGTVSEACDHYTIASGGGAYSLTAGQFVDVDVEFSPGVAGTHLCTIETGTDCANVSCTGTGEDPPLCHVTVDTLDFGTRTVGSNTLRDFYVRNDGGGLLEGNITEACDHYSLDSGGGPFSLANGEEVNVVVRFNPTVVGTHTCTIDIGTGDCPNAFCTGEAEPPPECQLTPASLDFGTVTIGSFVDLDFTIENIGGGTLTGTVSEVCVNYSIQAGAGAFSLANGETHVVTVRFEPLTAGTHNCDINTVGLCGNLPVTGVGQEPTACDVSPTLLDFGTVTVGDFSDLVFTITNTGGGTLEGSVSETCDHYEITAGGGAYSLGPSAFVDVTVRFQPTVAGVHPCTIETGTADCADVSCTGTGDPPPECSVSPDTLDFGTIVIGGSVELTFSVMNVGGGILSGSISEGCDHYAIIEGSGAYNLANGEFVNVRVEFAPTAVGTHTCIIDTGTGDCVNVFCTGVGDPQPECQITPASLDFGTVTVGNFADLVFTIQNTGGGLLTGDVSEGCLHYNIQSGGGAFSLANGETKDVTVRFEPVAAGTHNCQIDLAGLCADVPVTGVGEEPQVPVCDVSQTSLDFGTVTVGDFADLTFTITNIGTGTLTGSVTETCDHYEITSGGGAYSLTASQFVDVTVRFQPTVAGTHPCTIETGTECANVSCTGDGDDPPSCNVVPTLREFGTVTVGDFADLGFTLENLGGGTLTGSVTETCDHYEIISGGGAYSLTAGQYVDVMVRFQPTVAGVHNCTIETGADCDNVSCTGTGEEPQVPICDVSRTFIDFGTAILPGSIVDADFRITNIGTGTLTGEVTETCDHYSIQAGGGAFSLAAGEFVDVTVRFEPTAVGTHTCEVQTGVNCANVSCTGVGDIPPECDVYPTYLSFGEVPIGEYEDRTFHLTNIGGGTLTGSVTETCDHYEIVAGGGAYALAAGESLEVTVRFAPTIADIHLCSIQTDCFATVDCIGIGVVDFVPLVLMKDDGMGGAPVDPGQVFTYALYYENPNEVEVNNAVLVDMLPAELLYISSTGGVYDPGMHEVTWVIGMIPAFGSDIVELEVQVDPGTTPGSLITNVAQINSDETGPTPTEATEETPVSGGEIEVYFDIKPGSCPNPLNPKNNGVLPVAILGTADFDIRDIDPATVRLTREGMGATVAPLRWAFEDVATPFDGEPCDCHELTVDGYEDMTLKFDSQEVLTTLGLGSLRGETVPLMIVGSLFDGTDFSGEDCVRLKGGNPHDQVTGGGGLRFIEFDPGEELESEDNLISFDVPVAGHINLEIYDVHGRMVNRVLDRHMSSGVHSLSWDGRNGSGERLPAGVYFARVRNATESDTKKVVIVN